MPLKVEVDPNSGFCAGVIRTISNAEKYLSENPGKVLYSLGAIVHNDIEIDRLATKGMITLDKDDFDQMVMPVNDETILIRAHGEPPETYKRIEKLGFTLIDCTCPVVRKLQDDIREAYRQVHTRFRPGLLIIYGKIGHPEVMGLLGQVAGDAMVIENMEQLREKVHESRINFNRSIHIFSQTTKSPQEYAEICSFIKAHMSSRAKLVIHETICKQVENRFRNFAEFARSHDVIVFVSGKRSSNGQVLCDLCRKANIRTFQVQDASGVNSQWFRQDDVVGVCGATSTPKWLLEEVAVKIENLH